ncbi:MAG: molybdenum cofactor guanylyltransferase [Candidatus Omnitrophica bacterium]|nr:molybdenum cofactor guanylyltransferase [Candidatus Omnitrophota bacterium]MCM8803395.1 molybdenum cofactor guanylyltransferase [Candidatus Omnitrophota bacterium]
MNGIILAKGQKSERLNFDKAFIKFKNKKIIEIVVEKISPLFKEIYIITTSPKKFKIFENQKIKIVKDEIFCGPLGGIYNGLKISKSIYNFVFACDLPFLDVDFIKYMMKIEKNYDLLVPIYKNNFQLLHSIYSKRIIKTIEDMLNNKKYAVKEILKRVNVKFINEDDIKKITKNFNIFFNLNTENDLKKFLRLQRMSNGKTNLS